MKTLFLPLLAVSSILSVLAPRADAAAITFDASALQPRMLGPASFNQRNRSGVPGSVFRRLEANVSSAINDALNVNGGTIKTGSGTLTLDNSGFINGGILTAGGGTLSLYSGSVLSFWDHSAIRLFPTSGLGGTIDTNGFGVTISGGTILTRNADPLTDGLAGTVLTKTGSGTLTIDSGAGDGSVSVHVLNGTLDFEAGQTLDALVISGDSSVTLVSLNPPAAPAPVPEPASAVLLIVGALSASRSRRRRES